ncbi:MAG: 50S ribosomal protein L10 [Flavobacteriales bacterium]|jgi:large subunit ribosomal protein L10|tara:strand:+ start:2219 stop:2737 length:519 start_codon:yes stop_codon:yes gene_type:complete
MNKKEKNDLIDVLNNMIDENKNFYLTDISGLTAEQSSSLRRLCYKQNVSIKVVKNTLLKKAFDKNSINFDQFDDILKGNTSLMFADSAKSPANVIKDFRKKADKPILKGAHIEDEFYIGDNNLSMLANLKSKNELIADVIMLLQSPAKNVIASLQSSSTKLSGIVQALSDKK